MNEQRRQILQMLAEGMLSAEEAEALIDALEHQQPETPPAAVPGPKPRPRYLRVVMNSAETPDGDAPFRVNIRVPLQLLRAGVRLASLVPPQVLARANEELSRSGVPIDLTELKPQHLEDLVEQLDEVTVDVDDPDNKLRVFCE
jgi:hypothetical protein